MTGNTIENIKKEILGKPLNLTAMVEYQKGSVVSRTLINKESGSITLFAFDTGQSLSEHTAPFDAIICVIDGEADVKISGKSHIMKEGEMIIMPANESHAIKANISFKMLLIMIK